MAEFDPEKFQDKYVHYLVELETAYTKAFETMNERRVSELVHAIDQGVLTESEPVYEDGAVRIELPEDPGARVGAVLVDNETLEAVLDEYVEELRAELRRVFGLDEPA